MKMESGEGKKLTQHPQGKAGKNIDKEIYVTFQEVITSILGNKALTHTELMSQLNERLKNKFPGNISWYGETMKLDLEARGLIKRTTDKPQKYCVGLKKHKA